jgi:hypothetical protein
MGVSTAMFGQSIPRACADGSEIDLADLAREFFGMGSQRDFGIRGAAHVVRPEVVSLELSSGSNVPSVLERVGLVGTR